MPTGIDSKSSDEESEDIVLVLEEVFVESGERATDFEHFATGHFVANFAGRDSLLLIFFGGLFCFLVFAGAFFFVRAADFAGQPRRAWDFFWGALGLFFGGILRY